MPRKSKDSPEPKAKKPRRPKYHNIKVAYDGRTFDSLWECERYKLLREQEERGEISGLICQPRFLLQKSFRDSWSKRKILAIYYIADFQYTILTETLPREVVEDAKGIMTQAFLIKAKLFRYQNPGVELRLTMKPRKPRGKKPKASEEA